MVLHAGGSVGWVANCLFLSAKNASNTKEDCHDEINADIFEK